MQLKVPASLNADETMMLRAVEPAATGSAATRSGTAPDGSGRGRSRRRRKAPRASALSRLPAAAPGLTRLVARVASDARRLRPRYPHADRAGWRRWAPSWRQWLGAALACTGLTVILLGSAYAVTDIPDNLNSYATQQDNVYFWSDGTPMARTGWVRRQAMPLEDIPEDVRDAVLAAENASFYSDPGISLSGLGRALWRTVGQGETQGGSTITQQYVKNVYLNQDRSVGRKFTEAMLALKLDNQMSKDDILEGYLNTSWFGRGTYGIQRAAQAYYGKDVGDLDVSEAAFLASLLKGAGLYDPALSQANHDRAVERWSWILDRMAETGTLSKAERALYTKFPEPLKRAPGFDTGKQSDYLVELAARYAKKAAHLSDKEFDFGGFQIYTTFDRKQESALTDAVAETETTTLTYARTRGNAPKTTGFQARHELTFTADRRGDWRLTGIRDADQGGLAVNTLSKPAPVKATAAADTMPNAPRAATTRNPAAAPKTGTTYDYKAMAAYAEKHWNAYNKDYPDFSGRGAGGDCTNFVSQSLKAGGWKHVPGYVYDYTRWFGNADIQSHSFIGVNEWSWFAQNSKRTTPLANVYQLEVGDVLQVDFDKDGSKDHTMIVTYKSGGVPYLTYHSNNTLRRSVASVVASYPNAYYYAYRT
ncbi:transglycosylase domain-containing protein [Streptomyces iakyrus]|uniref:transglycosylase domain-containing protein n=1 Tax=Streptomyces iakyrus TaxID=68219 RepID=UPI0033B50F82